MSPSLFDQEPVGEYVLCTRTRRWVLLFGVLSAGMFGSTLLAIRRAAHRVAVECSIKVNGSPVFSGFGTHTPKAVSFALDPEYLIKTGVDIFTDFARSQTTEHAG